MDIKELIRAPKVEVRILDSSNIDKDFVKDFRKRNRLTQVALANILGVKKKTIEKWEQGINKISGSSAVLLTLLNSDETILSKLYSVSYPEVNEEEIFQTQDCFSYVDNCIENKVEKEKWSKLATECSLCVGGLL